MVVQKQNAKWQFQLVIQVCLLEFYPVQYPQIIGWEVYAKATLQIVWNFQ